MEKSITTSDVLCLVLAATTLVGVSISIHLYSKLSDLREQMSKPKQATIEQTITCN